MDLAKTSDELGQVTAREEARRSSLSDRIKASEQGLERKVTRIFRAVELLLAGALIGAAFADVWGDASRTWVKVLGLIAAIATIGMVEKYLKERLRGLIRWCMRSDARYIEGLREALGD